MFLLLNLFSLSRWRGGWRNGDGCSKNEQRSVLSGWPKDQKTQLRGVWSLAFCICSALLRCFDPPIWTPDVSSGRKTKFIKIVNEGQKIWLRRVWSLDFYFFSDVAGYDYYRPTWTTDVYIGKYLETYSEKRKKLRKCEELENLFFNWLRSTPFAVRLFQTPLPFISQGPHYLPTMISRVQTHLIKFVWSFRLYTCLINGG